MKSDLPQTEAQKLIAEAWASGCENKDQVMGWLAYKAVPVIRDAELWELREENRSFKNQLGTLSSTHAKDMTRLSDMIDKRETALGHIAAIMREKDESSEDLLIGSTAWKSVIRWSVYFQNAE